MRNFLRNTAATLALVIAGYVAWSLGDALGLAWDDAEAESLPAVEWLVEEGYTPAQPSQCQSDALSAMTTALKAERVEWLWASDLDTDRGAWGLAWSTYQRVALDTSIPCDRVATVIIHEWVHTVVTDIPEEELVADCVAARLRATLAPEAAQHTPYLDQARGCTATADQAARELIKAHGLG